MTNNKILLDNGIYHKSERLDFMVTIKYLQSIYNSVHRFNFSFLGLIVGRHRAGKSLFAITLASILDRTFIRYFKSRVVYDAKGFMRACNHLRDANIKGGVIVWDEAGVGLPAREWYDISNKAINYALQVIGYLNPIILFVTQDITFLDKQPRKLLHQFFEMVRPSDRFSITKPFIVEWNKRIGRVYFKYPRILWDGKLYTLKRIVIPLPPKELLEMYEEHSRPWKDKIMKAMEEKVNAMEVREARETLSLEKIKQIIWENWQSFEAKRSERPYKIKLDANLISYKFHIPYRIAMAMAREIEQELIKKAVENGQI